MSSKRNLKKDCFMLIGTVENSFCFNFLDNLRKNYKIMDLHNPMMDNLEKKYIEDQIEEEQPGLNEVPFFKFLISLKSTQPPELALYTFTLTLDVSNVENII